MSQRYLAQFLRTVVLSRTAKLDPKPARCNQAEAIEQYGGTIPTPLIVMVILRLAIIFASFGYRAPR